MKSGIYEIVNIVNGKRYIGSAVKFSTRFAVHRGSLRTGKHHSRYLQASWNKYGELAFEFRRLIVCAPSDTIFFEQRFIDALNPEYNTAKIAGSCLGIKHSQETRARRSQLNIGNKFALGKAPSELCRLRVAEANRRRKGFKRSPESIAATADAHKGMKRSAETRAKIAAKAKGRKWTDSAKAKLSATLSARELTPERRSRLAERCVEMAAKRKGTKLSHQHRKDISEASKRMWKENRESILERRRLSRLAKKSA